jgi:hypothetical protein
MQRQPPLEGVRLASREEDEVQGDKEGDDRNG